MRTASLGLHQPGGSWLHRAPAGTKLVGLVVFAVAVFALGRWLPALGLLGVAVVLIYVSTGLGLGTLWRQVRPLWVFVVFLVVMQVIARAWHNAVAVPAALVLLVSVAALVTLTTPTTDLVDTVVRAASPLRRVGVRPDRVGLAVLLGLRCVPLVASLAARTREAQIARGGTFDLRAFTVPLLVSALRSADALGEALVARGVDDE